MDILFFTLLDFNSINDRNIYTDLLREFTKRNHKVYIISPAEKRKGIKTHVIEEPNVTILKLRIGNIQKTNVIEKGFSTLILEAQFIIGIKKYFSMNTFDLVIYSTPPITFCNAIAYVKKRDHAKTYLLLKDIFPQNAVDLGMLKISGPKGILYRYFRGKEKKLYAISDKIGCMSKGNVDYILKHNSEISSDKIEICPNCIDPQIVSLSTQERILIRQKYNVPINKKIFIYGGNLGRPQDIPFIIKCLDAEKDNENLYFWIIGNGTEYRKLESYVHNKKPMNMKLMYSLPHEEFECVVAACDVGLIFLDDHFTIPNFPSRLLSYMQAGIPVLACTDSATDLRTTIIDGAFGWWCRSNSIEKFKEQVNIVLTSDCKQKGLNGLRYLQEHYAAEKVYAQLIDFIVKAG